MHRVPMVSVHGHFGPVATQYRMTVCEEKEAVGPRGLGHKGKVDGLRTSTRPTLKFPPLGNNTMG